MKFFQTLFLDDGARGWINKDINSINLLLCLYKCVCNFLCWIFCLILIKFTIKYFAKKYVPLFYVNSSGCITTHPHILTQCNKSDISGHKFWWNLVWIFCLLFFVVIDSIKCSRIKWPCIEFCYQLVTPLWHHYLLSIQ